MWHTVVFDSGPRVRLPLTLCTPVLLCMQLTAAIPWRVCVQMPIHLQQLVNLKYLNLSYNQFDITGMDFSGTTQLRVLHLAAMGAPDATELHESICLLTELEVLRLNGTRLPFLPVNLGNLVKLNVLQVELCRLEQLPESLTRLTNLTELQASDCEFSTLPARIGDMRALEVATFLTNGDTMAIPPSFLSLTRLRKLHMPEDYCLVKPPGFNVYVDALQASGCEYRQES